MSLLLAPLSWLYTAIVVLRNLFFDWGWFQATRTKAFVVAVGNMTVGGTGKTPITAYLSRELESKGYRVAIVSRGYGGSYSESVARVDIQKKSAAQYYGDEPAMLATQLQMPVFVGRSRVAAAERAIQESQADCVVADDGFQHRWLYRDLNIVVFDATDSRLQVLPAGRLREPLSGLLRAHTVFVTRAGLVSLARREEVLDVLKKYGFSEEKKNLFFVEFKVSNIVHVHTYARLIENQCFLLSAIGKPQNFEHSMKQKLHVQKHFVFSDHHSWSQREWTAIISECHKSGGYPLVMTEKDAVKVRNLDSENYPIYFVQMDVDMDKRFQMDALLERAGRFS